MSGIPRVIRMDRQARKEGAIVIRMTNEPCARCDDRLATSNKNRDRLCGSCQRELGASRGEKSLALREWIERGRKREVRRNPPNAVTATIDLMKPEDLIALVERANAELARRRQEAESLLRILGSAPTPVGETH